MGSLIGLISDAHGNSLAFERAVSILIKEGVEKIFFLGDAVGYIPNTTVLNSLEALGNRVQCIKGNHEVMLLEKQCDPVREEIYKFETIRKNLTSQQIDMLSSWPTFLIEKIGGKKVLLVHGSPSDPTYGYVYPDTVLTQYTPDADWVFMGNTHYPFIRECGATKYVNIGSCGMPRDDGRFGSATIFNYKKNIVRVLRFDITTETKTILKQYPNTHNTVKNVFERRCSKIVGTIL
ncbi:MAG: metallophosphoesterase family protein [Gammaproteobacteria bacterium]